MEFRFAPFIISTVVCVILAASILIPIVSDATATEKTVTNDGYFDLIKLDASDAGEHTISWASSNGKIITVDGVAIDVTTWGLGSYQQVSCFVTESDLFRLGVPGSPGALQWIQVRGATIAYAQANTSFEATIGSGNVSITMDGGAARTLTYTEAYLLAPTGDYVMKKSDESAYLLADSEIYGLGYTTLTGGNAVFKVAGTVEDMTVESVTTVVSISDIVVDYQDTDEYEDLYLFDKVTFVATIDDAATDCTYSYVIVPKEVTGQLTEHLGDAERAILGILPVLVIIGIVLGVVVVLGRRAELF